MGNSGSKKLEPKKRNPSPASSQNPVTGGWEKYFMPALALAVFVLYIPSVKLGFTELDDSIFIREMTDFYDEPGSLIHSFKRGVFHETNDIYYRPLLMASFILNHKASGRNIEGYHWVNLLLHLVSVLLLYQFLKKLNISPDVSFVLTLIFAVHPVLMQAVVWIPGRNDTLLAVFVLLFFLWAVRFQNQGSYTALLFQSIALLAALLTKESAVFAAPVLWLLIVYAPRRKWFEKTELILYGSWLMSGLGWFLLRSHASLKHEQAGPEALLDTLLQRWPVLIQYLGKLFFPLNLSVFPVMEDTDYIYGIAAMICLALLLFFSRTGNRRLLWAGLGCYILFLAPALMVPSSLNDQDFEHRLYLPFMGILIVLSQTVLFRNRLKERQWMAIAVSVALILGIVNRSRQKYFNDPVTFWEEAVRTSPHSAYANMMLGARLDETDPPRAEALIRKAYLLNPEEKYINYYMGVLLQTKDSVLASEPFLLREKKISDYYMLDFHLARVAFEKQDKPEAAACLERYLGRNTRDRQAHHNLLLLYVEMNDTLHARRQANRMLSLGLQVPPEIQQQLNRQD